MSIYSDLKEIANLLKNMEDLKAETETLRAENSDLRSQIVEIRERLSYLEGREQAIVLMAKESVRTLLKQEVEEVSYKKIPQHSSG